MMTTTLGRPRKACSTCKSQKIRCLGERPTCSRCLRLKHPCIYSADPPRVRNRSKTARNSAVDAVETSHPVAPDEIAGRGGLQIESSLFPLSNPAKERYVEIPDSLILTLVEAYYDNVYNANLLLHRKTFLESLAAGTARTHIVLSVCAWGANFYREANGQAPLKDYGFMTQWAKRAGSLVFQEAEELHEENIVTFTHLALFWHSQGSWRIASLYKGNAVQLLHIIGVGSGTMIMENSLESEIRRRRFWACYLMHCQTPERLVLFEPVEDIPNLPLPWPDEDFDAGISTHPRATLDSIPSNGGVFAELIKIITLWSTVLSLIKSPNASFSSRISSIHALDEKVSEWWRNLRPDFKLTPSTITTIPSSILPKVLFLNFVYHQSLCALHASIVPLFCWTPSDDNWASARQLSAQAAFEHASSASALISSALSTLPKLSVMPGFVAYTAYCGCAIQIPFMWCLDPLVKERARENVKANIDMIDAMASYWQFSALLKVHVRCLYNIHAKNPTILENEPKYIDITKLTSFKINSTNARNAILGYTSILHSTRDGWTRPGEEDTLQIEEPKNDAQGTVEPPRHEELDAFQADLQNLDSPNRAFHYPLESTAHAQQGTCMQESKQNHPSNLPSPPTSHNPELLAESPTLPAFDVFQPFFDPEMLDLFPGGEIPDLSTLQTQLLNLDYFEIEGGWKNTSRPSNTEKDYESIAGTFS